MNAVPRFIERIVGLPTWRNERGHFLVRREYHDGPRWCEAIRGAREMRFWTVPAYEIGPADIRRPGTPGPHAFPSERERGIPEGWVGAHYSEVPR